MFQSFYHGEPLSAAPERAVCVTNGSQDGIAKAMEMFLDEGDSLLIENPTYRFVRLCVCVYLSFIYIYIYIRVCMYVRVCAAEKTGPLTVGAPAPRLSCYCSGTLAALRPLQCNLVSVNTDHEGLDPDHLRSILESWPADKKKPKVRVDFL
jgi:hypothetical protein